MTDLPGVCRSCRAAVWYRPGKTRVDGRNVVISRWRDADGRIHRCKEEEGS